MSCTAIKTPNAGCQIAPVGRKTQAIMEAEGRVFERGQCSHAFSRARVPQEYARVSQHVGYQQAVWSDLKVCGNPDILAAIVQGTQLGTVA